MTALLVVPSCTMCCRCYRLAYQISAAAPYTALNGSPFQRERRCLQCSCDCLSTSIHRVLCILLGCYDWWCSHYYWTECISAESTNLHASPVYTYPALARPCKIGVHDLNRVITECALYWNALKRGSNVRNFGHKSFYAIDCTGTDNQHKETKHLINTKHKKRQKKHSPI